MKVEFRHDKLTGQRQMTQVAQTTAKILQPYKHNVTKRHIQRHAMSHTQTCRETCNVIFRLADMAHITNLHVNSKQIKQFGE